MGLSFLSVQFVGFSGTVIPLEMLNRSVKRVRGLRNAISPLKCRWLRRGPVPDNPRNCSVPRSLVGRVFLMSRRGSSQVLEKPRYHSRSNDLYRVIRNASGNQRAVALMMLPDEAIESGLIALGLATGIGVQ